MGLHHHERVLDTCSKNDATTSVAVLIPTFSLKPFLPYLLGNPVEIKSILFGNLNGILLRQLYNKIRTTHQALKKKK